MICVGIAINALKKESDKYRFKRKNLLSEDREKQTFHATSCSLLSSLMADIIIIIIFFLAYYFIIIITSRE